MPVSLYDWEHVSVADRPEGFISTKFNLLCSHCGKEHQVDRTGWEFLFCPQCDTLHSKPRWSPDPPIALSGDGSGGE